MLSKDERRRIAHLVTQRWASDPGRPASGILRDALRLVAVPRTERPEGLPLAQRIRFHDTVSVVSSALVALMAGSEQGALGRLREMAEAILGH